MKIATKILPFVVIVVLILLIRNNVQGIIESKDRSGTKSSLEKKLAEEKKENQYLKEKLTYVKTDQFVEEEAQNKLGYLKEGEYFVIAPTPSPDDTVIEIDTRPKWKKWFDLFF